MSPTSGDIPDAAGDVPERPGMSGDIPGLWRGASPTGSRGVGTESLITFMLAPAFRK